MIAISYLGFAQQSQAGLFRIANRTTATDENLPVGTQIFAIADSSLWQVIVALPTGTTVDVAYAASPAKVTRVNKGATFKVFQQEQGAIPGTITIPSTPFGPVNDDSNISVSLNGVVLKFTEYSVAGAIVTISIPQYQYDRVSIAYTY